MLVSIALRVVIVVALLCSSSAWSRVPMGSRPHLAPGYSKCFFSRHPSFIREWLKTLPGTEEEKILLKRNQNNIDTCFGINSDGSRYFQSYDYEGIRAAIVRFLLQSKRDNLPQQAPPGLANVNWYSSISNVSDQGNAAAVLANDMGFCVARTNWEAVRSIIYAVDAKMERRILVPKSVEDRELRLVNAELSRIIPSISACLPAGIKFVVDRVKLRRVLEEAAFHATDDGTTFDGLSALKSGGSDA